MEKLILFIGLLSILLVSNCGKWSRMKAAWSGNSVECYEGVRYIQFISGVSVAYGLDGKPLPCK